MMMAACVRASSYAAMAAAAPAPPRGRLTSRAAKAAAAGHKILFGPVENPVLRGSHQSMDVIEHPVIATLRAEHR